jgi:hypothetical protein
MNQAIFDPFRVETSMSEEMDKEVHNGLDECQRRSERTKNHTSERGQESPRGGLGEKLDKDVRMVWIAPTSEDLHRAERDFWAQLFAEQTRTLDQLRTELIETRKSEPKTRMSKPRTATSQPWTSMSKTKKEATTAPLLPDVELVAAIEASGLSMNKIEKAAGVWSGAISKLKRGQLPPGHQKPRRQLLRYLEAA